MNVDGWCLRGLLFNGAATGVKFDTRSWIKLNRLNNGRSSMKLVNGSSSRMISFVNVASFRHVGRATCPSLFMFQRRKDISFFFERHSSILEKA